METNEHIAALEHEGQLLLAAARSADLESPVPSCPGWVLRDLLAHIGFVHRWATKYVDQGVTEMVAEPDEAGVLALAPPDDLLLAWVAEGHAALVRALSSAPSDLRCWTFLAAPSPRAFWARRQAHETAVHRVDAELASGAHPTSIPAPFAADGVDELLLGFLARPGSKRYTKVGPGTASFEAIDTPASWTVTVSSSGIDTKRGVEPGDLQVRAPAQDLYLTLWDRRSPEGLELNGAPGLLADWKKLFRVTWS
jgi:uncharacterized protein (TIGR03083 family)